MPITFNDGWNGLNLAKLKVQPVAAGADPALAVANIALFWKAKTRMKKRGPLKLGELDATIKDLEDKEAAKKLDPSLRFTGKMAEQLTGARAERTTIVNALARDKVTAPMVKKFAPEIAGKFAGATTPKLLDTVMEQIHNDRLRIADAEMLKRYDGLKIRRAIVEAKPRFTQDPRVAALFTRALATDGDPVTVTQGVHQSDDPHFDVTMPGEAQQYHIEVTLGAPLTVRSVSYMLGATKQAGVRTVGPDPAAAAAAAPVPAAAPAVVTI